MSAAHGADTAFVFGHGKDGVVLGKKADVAYFRDYLSAALDHVRAGIKAGQSKEEIAKAPSLKGFDDVAQVNAADRPCRRARVGLRRAGEEIEGCIGHASSAAVPAIRSPGPSGSEHSLRRHHHRQRRRRRNHGAGARRRARLASSSSSAGSPCLRSRTTGIPRRCGSTCATARPSAGSTVRARSFFPTRTTASAAIRSSGAACSIGCGVRTFRQSSTWTASLACLADRLRHARARTTTAPSSSTMCTESTAAIRPNRPRGPFPYAPIPHAAGMATIVDGLRRQGLQPSHLPLGLDSTGRAGRLRPVRHLQLLPVPNPRQERRGGLRHRARARSRQRRAVDQRAGAPPRHRSRREERRGRRHRTRWRRPSALGHRSSSSRAARSTRRRCCCDRRAARIRTDWRTRPGSSAGVTWRTWRR